MKQAQNAQTDQAAKHSRHRRHHFVPQFYLRGWVGADGKIACYRWVRGNIVVSRLGTRGVAYKENLYTIPEAPDDQRQRVEKEFFAKLDERAAHVHRQLIDEGVRALTVQDRMDWSIFLMSLRIRTPHSIDRIRTDATADFVRGLNDRPEEYEALRKPTDPPTLLEWVQQNAPSAILNYAPRMVPQLIVSDKPVDHVFRMHWWIRHLSGPSELVTSDHPCVFTAGFGDANCVVALPLTPKVVFYAANRRDLEARWSNHSSQAIAFRTNQSVVQQTFEYAFALEGNKKLFIAKHLPRRAVP